MNNKLITLVISIILYCSNLIVYGQNINIDTLNSESFEVEYECITPSLTYEIDLLAFRVTNLANNVVYTIGTDYPQIFDELDYQSKSFYFVPISSTRWKWNNSILSTDTIVLEFSGYYANLELGSSASYMFGAYAYGYGIDRADVFVDIVTSMYVSGPSIDCSNPVSYSLQNMPANYASASWVIKQSGATKASGTGISASANNLTDGPGEVIYTISFTCLLEDISISKAFWYGKPTPSILGPDELMCGFPEWFFVDHESYQWGDFEWSTDNNLDIQSTTTGHKAEIEGLSEGLGQVFVDVTNTCGSKEERLIVWVDCFDFFIFPNPADDIVEIKLDDSKIDLNNIQEYEIKLYNSQQIILSSLKSKSISNKIDISHLTNGAYWVQVVYQGKPYYKQLIVNH